MVYKPRPEDAPVTIAVFSEDAVTAKAGSLGLDGVQRGAMRSFGGTVERDGAAFLGQMNQHHGLAADAGRGGLADAQRERRGHGGVDGVAAGFQHFLSGLGGQIVLRGDHAPGRGADALRAAGAAASEVERVFGVAVCLW